MMMISVSGTYSLRDLARTICPRRMYKSSPSVSGQSLKITRGAQNLKKETTVTNFCRIAQRSKEFSSSQPDVNRLLSLKAVGELVGDVGGQESKLRDEADVVAAEVGGGEAPREVGRVGRLQNRERQHAQGL